METKIHKRNGCADPKAKKFTYLCQEHSKSPTKKCEIEGEGFGGVALLLEHESVLLLEHERHGCAREHPCLHLFRVFLG